MSPWQAAREAPEYRVSGADAELIQRALQPRAKTRGCVAMNDALAGGVGRGTRRCPYDRLCHSGISSRERGSGVFQTAAQRAQQ
jgi:hypothetical protein